MRTEWETTDKFQHEGFGEVLEESSQGIRVPPPEVYGQPGWTAGVIWALRRRGCSQFLQLNCCPWGNWEIIPPTRERTWWPGSQGKGFVSGEMVSCWRVLQLEENNEFLNSEETAGLQIFSKKAQWGMCWLSLRSPSSLSMNTTHSHFPDLL